MTSVNDEAAANSIADSIIEKCLAACVQRLPRMRSVYRWEDKIESSAENLLLIKTSSEKYSELEAFISSVNPYETPEIIAIDITAASEPYRQWLLSEVGSDL